MLQELQSARKTSSPSSAPSDEISQVSADPPPQPERHFDEFTVLTRVYITKAANQKTTLGRTENKVFRFQSLFW